jgi:hypothetical protein
MMYMAMSRETWLARGHSADITIDGFVPCKPLFGLA